MFKCDRCIKWFHLHTYNVCHFSGVGKCLGVKLVPSLWNFCMILFSFAFSAFTARSKCQGRINSAPLTQITEKVFPDMCWCPGLYPCPALCVCPWHSAEQGEMKELLCWCQSQMPSTTTRPRHRLLCLHSPLTLSGRGPAQTCRWPH